MSPVASVATVSWLAANFRILKKEKKKAKAVEERADVVKQPFLDIKIDKHEFDEDLMEQKFTTLNETFDKVKELDEKVKELDEKSLVKISELVKGMEKAFVKICELEKGLITLAPIVINHEEKFNVMTNIVNDTLVPKVMEMFEKNNWEAENVCQIEHRLVCLENGEENTNAILEEMRLASHPAKKKKKQEVRF